MNYQKILLALGVGALLLALLSIWIPWPALVVLFFLVVIVPSPFGRQPRQFVRRKIEAYRIVSEYERQRRQRSAQASSQPTKGAGSLGPSPLSPPTPDYEQGYQAQVPASSAQPKQDPSSAFYDQPQVHYPEQALPPMHGSI
jgi:hypothetical protein